MVAAGRRASRRRHTRTTAEGLDPSRLPAELVQRRYRYWVDVARAHAALRSLGEVVAALLRAERTAPEEVRHDTVVRDMVRQLVRHRRQTVTPQLRDLARRLGMSSG